MHDESGGRRPGTDCTGVGGRPSGRTGLAPAARALLPSARSRVVRMRTAVGRRMGDRAVVVVAVTGLLASYGLTWPLWQSRVDPPNLPAVAGLAAFGYGGVLVVSALVALGFPRVGGLAHATVLALAVAGDQTRLQPEVVSLALILGVAAWGASGLAVVRWHLVSLWGWSGVHKALSAGWPDGGAGFIARGLGIGGLGPAVAVVVPGAEIGLALLALIPRAWPALRIGAPLFHGAVVLTLAVMSFNPAVWPWNLGLAVAAPLVFRDRGDARALVPGRPWLRVVAAFMVAYPFGYYLGVVDAYPAHVLYAAGTVEAAVCTGEDGVDACTSEPFSTWRSLDVPLPPERRLFVAWFERVCRPGETLRIEGIWTRLGDRSRTEVPCRP